jgi:hypothetical protein
MHTVEISRPSADLRDLMAWLRQHRTATGLFELAFLPGRRVRFRVEFKNPSEASAFTGFFDGEESNESRGHLAA